MNEDMIDFETCGRAVVWAETHVDPVMLLSWLARASLSLFDLLD
jgi:hypothetical protein